MVALPAYRRWSLTTQLVRLPLTMTPLAFLLLATAATGNYRLGGVMITAATVAEVAVAAPAGRFLDRVNTAAVLSGLLLAAGGVLGLLTLAGALSWPGVVLVGLAVFSAVLTAGTPAGLRKILAGTVPARLLTPALSVDAVLIEATIIVGPLAVAAAAAVAQVGGVALMATTSVVAAVLVRGLIAAPDAASPSASGCTAGSADARPRSGAGSNGRTVSPSAAGTPGDHRRRLRSRSLALWLGLGVVAAHGVGLAEVSALPLAHRIGGGTFMAVLLQGVLCAAGAAAGLLYGARSARLQGTPLHRATGLLAGLGVGLLMLTVSASIGWTLAGYLVVGACTAPLVTTVLVRMQELAPPERAGEAFGLNSAATGVGFALAGAALAALPLHVAVGTGLVGTTAALIAGLVLTDEQTHP